LNLNGGISTAPTVSQLASPTTPKLCNLPSTIPLIPTPIEKNINKNESVTVTHFSDLHGGVVEKISVPVTSGSSSFMDTEQKSPKMEFSTTRTSISNNPFADEILNTSKTIITTTTSSSSSATSPTVKISTNNPFHSSFNGNDASTPDKSVKISFSILGTKNPFDENNTSEESNGIDSQLNNSNDSNNNRSYGDNDQSIDDVDTSISSINLKIDKNNENNITMIKMESTDKKQANGELNTTAKKVNISLFQKYQISSLAVYLISCSSILFFLLTQIFF